MGGRGGISLRPTNSEIEEFAVEHDCRLVVTGDTKQHHGVQGGNALRILERSGAITQAELTEIYRRHKPRAT
jgi:hypothetical protein